MECVVLAALQVLLAPLHQLLLMLLQEMLIRYVQVVHRVVTGIAVKATPTAAVRRTLTDQDLQIYALKVAFQEFHVV
jgi:orotate phosphoribosyltransferase-like protein|tara:strand:- start:125 stop:355 length:231 start_codon:yes stop_codon:yes gene_type:complete